MSEVATGVALLLVGVLAVAGPVVRLPADVACRAVGLVALARHVARHPAGVAHVLALLLGLLALPGDVAAAAAVVAG